MVLKIYKVNGCDWVAAYSMEEAISCLMKTCGLSRSEAYDSEEAEIVSVKKANKLMYFDEDTGKSISFMQELHNRVRAKEKFPQFFASEEY